MHAAPSLRGWMTVVAVALTPVLVLGLAPVASASSGVKCHQSGQYGSTCIDITGNGLKVKDVQGYFAPPNRDYLSHRRWALELTKYRCNPIGKTRHQCHPKNSWRTRIRKGNPPHQGSMCTVFEPGGVGFQQCRDYGLAYADAHFGDWRRFYRLPHRFHRKAWLCNELVVRKHHHWKHNGAPGTPGERGCAEVHR
jgi:hypothetical protein